MGEDGEFLKYGSLVAHVNLGGKSRSENIEKKNTRLDSTKLSITFEETSKIFFFFTVGKLLTLSKKEPGLPLIQ